MKPERILCTIKGPHHGPCLHDCGTAGLWLWWEQGGSWEHWVSRELLDLGNHTRVEKRAAAAQRGMPLREQ